MPKKTCGIDGCTSTAKGMAAHKRNVHGVGGSPKSTSSTGYGYDGNEPWGGQGELGRILGVAEAGEPLRAKQMRDLYLKDAIADNPVHDAVYFESPSGRLDLIAKLPAGSKRRQI